MTGNRISGVAASLFIWALLSVPQAEAVILNLGIDIANNGSTTITSFYDESSNGENVTGGWTFLGLGIGGFNGETYTITFNPTTVFGGYTINSAVIFVDAVHIESDDDAEVRVQGTLLGELSNTSHAVTTIPVVTGGTIHAPDPGDIDNTYFALPAGIAGQLATDSTFQVSFKNADFNGGFFPNTNDFRVDGINIQANATLIPQQQPQPHLPEPGSLMLFSLGSLGAAGFMRRRKASELNV